MPDKPAKKGKLLFKGDKKEKKKKRKQRDEDEYDGAESTQEGWVRVDSIDDLVGPIFITHPSDPTICLTVDEEDRFFAYPLPEEVSKTEPLIVNQVFVGSKLIGSSTSRFTFKSFAGKYLSSDKVGVTKCDREAISLTEEWEPMITEAGVVFQNAYQKYLMVDEVANGGFKIRADSDDIGFCETFRVYCQAKFKYKRKKEAKEKIKTDQLELENVKKNQSWGGGKLHITHEDAKKLKRAKSEGKFHEAMLDRRSKMKADRYCK
ncbi:unnamed protein product [Cunninghamella blakesleeana]